MDCGNNQRHGAQSDCPQVHQQDRPKEPSLSSEHIADLESVILRSKDEIQDLKKCLNEKTEIIQVLMEEKKQLFAKSQRSKIMEEKIHQLSARNKMLEDVCLRIRGKNQGNFGRKLQDKDTVLDKMTNKMLAKLNKKKGKQVVVENQEEETVSLIPARCAKKSDLERKSWETLTVEHRVHLSQLEENILSLTETLETQKQLLSQSDQSWQDKYDAVEEKSALAANGFETRIQNLLSECKAVEEKYQEQIDTSERLELENQVLVQKQQNQESEIQLLTDESEILEEICLKHKRWTPSCFRRNLQDRDTELDKMKKKMEVKLNKKKGKQVVVEKKEEEAVSLIPARCTKVCDLERKSWETLTVEHRVHLSQLEENILSLTETLETQKQLLSQSDQSWQDKYDAVEEKSALVANGFETRIQNLLSECKAVEEKYQEQIDTSERLELENQVLVQKQQNQESEIQLLTDESEILEEICLKHKRRTPSCFRRNLEDRDTELDKMKKKMEVKLNKKKGKQVVVENKEEEVVSLIPARCTKVCDLERKSWETLTVEHRVHLSQLEENILSLTETLEAQKQLLSQSNQSWQDKYDAVEKKSALAANGFETRIQNLLSECKAVEETCQERIDASELENQVLVQKQQSQESEIHLLTDESEILEEICLQFKKRTLGYCGRKMQDRDTELDKMKKKMEVKLNKEKGKQVVVENQEEETVSLIPARCAKKSDLERKSWETPIVLSFAEIFEQRFPFSQLEEDILSLAETFEPQKQLLSQSNQSWQDTYDAFEENSALAANGFETRIQNLPSECKAVEETCQERIDTSERVELEIPVMVHRTQSQESEIQLLTDEGEILEEICLQHRSFCSFGRKLQDEDTELGKMKNEMEVKKGKQVVVENQEEETVSLIPARCAKKSNLERKSWETLTVEHRFPFSQLEEDILSLAETFEPQKQLLSQSNQSWQDTYDAFEENSALAANGFETRILNLPSECKAVEETCRERIDTSERVELEIPVMVHRTQSQESEIQLLTDEGEILEEICLQHRSFCCPGRKLQDGDTELGKMKNEMEVKKGKQVVVENQEEETVSPFPAQGNVISLTEVLLAQKLLWEKNAELEKRKNKCFNLW